MKRIIDTFVKQFRLNYSFFFTRQKKCYNSTNALRFFYSPSFFNMNLCVIVSFCITYIIKYNIGSIKKRSV